MKKEKIIYVLTFFLLFSAFSMQLIFASSNVTKVDNITIDSKTTTTDDSGSTTPTDDDKVKPNIDYEPIKNDTKNNEDNKDKQDSKNEDVVVPGSDDIEPTESSYKIISGDGQTYIIGKDKNIKYRIDANYSLFRNGGAIYVDEKYVEPKYYEVTEGIEVTLIKEYLDILKEGEHELKIIFNNGLSITTTFTITKEKPTTNNIMIIFLIILFILLLLIAILAYTIKQKINKRFKK